MNDQTDTEKMTDEPETTKAGDENLPETSEVFEVKESVITTWLWEGNDCTAQ